MSNEEKKYTIDDILEEYDKKASDFRNENESEAELNILQEENDSYDDCIEPENIINSFASETLLRSGANFDNEAFGHFMRVDREITDILIDSIGFDDAELSEEIFADADDDSDDDIPEEIIESGISDDATNIELPLEKDETGILCEVSEWSKADDSKEFEAAEIQQDVDNALSSDKGLADDAEKIENVSQDNASAEKEFPNDIEGEDVNDRFMNKLLKWLFPWKGDSASEVIRKIIFLVAVTVFVAAGILLISTLAQSRKALADKAKVQEIITTTVVTSIDGDGNFIVIAPTEEQLADHYFNVAEHFKNINEDYVGYLEIAGCDIYEPVMQGNDNEYYLTHNYYGGKNKAGTVFLDYRCTVSEEYNSPNLVLYGHNQEDGTMFGNLKNYKQNIEFYRENPVVKFNPEFETSEYLIYGFFVTHTRPEQDSNGEVFHYHDYIEAINDEDAFDWYINEIQERNQIISPVDVQYGDELLCLSTCSNEFSNSRFVIFARKLRDGESVSDYDFSEAYFNPNAKGVDWEAIISGNTTSEESEETEITEEIIGTEDSEETYEESITEISQTDISDIETEIPETSETIIRTTAPTQHSVYSSTYTESSTSTAVPTETVTEKNELETTVSETTPVQTEETSVTESEPIAVTTETTLTTSIVSEEATTSETIVPDSPSLS